MSTSLRSSVGHPDPVELDFTVTRALVPTERQRVGASPGQPPALAEDDSRFGRDTDIECGVAATLWQRIRGGLDAVNPAKIEGPKTPLFVFAASSALGGWSSAMLGLAAPEIQATFGVSVTAMVAISSVTGFFTMVTGLPLGYLVDRVNRVILVRIAQVSAPIGDVICALAPSYGVFLSGELGSEIARTPGAGADMPLLADYYSSRSRARVYAFLDISSMLGGLISVPLLGVMLEHFGWRQSTLVLAAMSTVVALLTFRLREPRRGTMDRLDAGVEEEYAGEEPPPPSISEALRAAWQVRSLRMQAVAGMVGSFTVPLAMLTSLILASKFALGPEQRSLISLAQIVAMIPFSLIGAAIADRLLAVKPASVAILQGVLALISGFVMVGQAFAPDLTSFVILSVLPACLGAILDPVSSSISSMVVPPGCEAWACRCSHPSGWSV